MNPSDTGRQTLPSAFRTAFAGVRDFARERNSRIQCCSAVIAIACGVWAKLPATSWAVLVLTITVVLALEATNCAIERVVDLASPGYHDLARQAKDLAAGAVLIAAVGAVVIGALLFGPAIVAAIGT